MSIRIDDADNRAIRGRVFALERKAGFLSTAPENQLADAGADCINRYHRLPDRLQIFVERLDDEQLPTFKRFVLDGGDHGADYACELHVLCAKLRAAVSADVPLDHVDEYVEPLVGALLGFR